MKHNNANRRGMPFSVQILNSKYLPICRKSGLATLLICLFGFQFVCLAQESPVNREATGIGGDNTGTVFESRQQTVNLSYKYILNNTAFKERQSKHPKLTLKNYPIIHYEVDHSTTPNIRLGDSIPIFLNNMAFHFVDNQGDIRVGTLGDFTNGKLLVLDFWATWCAPCVASMDHWQKIKSEVVDDLEILGVTLDNNYKALYYGVEKGWQLPLTFGPESFILNSMFFDRPVISRMAWIKDGRVIAFTGTKDYDLQLVKDVIAGKEVEIPMDLTFTYSSK